MATTAIVYRLIARDSASAVFNRVGRSATNLQSTSAKVGAAIKKGLTIGAIATAGLGVATLKAAGDFEKNMNRVEALSGATGKQLLKLRDQAKSLGNSTQYSASQSADAMAQLATAGLTVNQIYGAMPSVLSLASSEQLDLTRAAEITTSVLTGYGMSIKQVPHAVDAMVKASVKANTSVDDIGEAFKYAGPIAHQAGLKFEETVASMALMGNAGIKASMAGTALRGAVTRLLSPTDKVQATLDELGISVSTADGKLRPLNTIVEQLAKSGATTGQIMTIFGQRAGPGMAALIQQGSDKLVKLTGQLEHSGGTADRISKIQMKGLRGELVRLKNAWQVFLIEVGDTGVLSAATKALSGVTKTLRVFTGFVNTKGIPAAKSFGHSLAGMVPVGQITSNLGAAKSAVSDFFSGLLGSRKKTVGGLLDGLFDSSPHLGSGGAQPLSKKKTAPLQAKPHYGTGQVAPTTGTLGPALKPDPHLGTGAVAPLTKPKTKPAMSAAQKLGKQLRDAVSDGISGADFTKLGSALGHALGTSVQWIAKNAGKLGKQLGKALAAIDWVDVGKMVGGKAFGFAIGFVSSFGSDLFSADFWKKHFWDTLIAALSFVGIGKLAGPLAKVFSHIPILKAFSPMLRGIEKLTAPIGKGLGKVFSFLGKGLWKGIAKIFPQAAAILEREAGQFTTRLGLWGLKLLELGNKAMQGLGKGITSGAEWVLGKIGQLIGLLLKPFAKAGGWLIKKGTSAVTGLGRGLASGGRAVGGLAKRVVVDPVLTQFRNAGTWLLSKGTAIVTGAKNGIINGAKGLAGWARAHLVTPVTSRFSAAGTWLRVSGTNMVTGLLRGMLERTKTIGTWLKTHLVDPVVNWVKSLFGIHSPSTVFAGFGTSLVAGLLLGIATRAKGIGGWILSHLVTPVLGVYKGVGLWLLSKGIALVGGLKNGVLTAAKGIAGWIRGHMSNPVIAVFAHAGLWLLGKGRAFVGGLKNGVLGAAKGIGGWARSHVVAPQLAIFRTASSWLPPKGRAMVSGLKNGIWGAAKGVGKWIKSHLVDPIINAVKKYFGIHSPSTVMASIGGHLVAGLIKGLAQHNGASIVKRIFGDMPSALGALVSKGLVSISALPGKALSALGGLGGSLAGFLGLGDSKVSGSAQQIGQLLMKAAGWGPSQWPALKALWNGESGWNYRALNASSGAYGIPQALPASKMASAGSDWRTNPATQIKWGLSYIKSRYGSPAAAYAAWLGRSPHWYDSGGVASGAGYLPKKTPRPERVLSPQQTEAFERLVGVLESGGQQQPLIGHLVVQAGGGASADDIIAAAMYQARVARRRGVHTR